MSSTSLVLVSLVIASITAIARGSKDSDLLLIAHSDTVLAVNPIDASETANSLHIEDVVRIASDGRGGFVAATWNGSDSALAAFDSLHENLTAKTIIPNFRVDGLALNPSDDSAIVSSGTEISSVVIGNQPPGSKVELLTDHAVAIAFDHCNDSRLFYSTKDSPLIKVLDGNNKVVASIGNLTHVRAIALDPWSGLIYWIDKVGRREFRLERADRDGNARRTVCQRVSDQNPFDLSVGREYIAWSDWYNNAVWKMDKINGGCEPEVLRRFSLARPMGVDFTQRPHSCSDRGQLSDQIQTSQPSPKLSRNGTEQNQETKNLSNPKSVPYECVNFCLNGGVCMLDDGTGIPVCACAFGHYGLRCELDSFYFWAFVIATLIASLAIVAVLCLGVAYCRSLRKRRPPVVISKRHNSGVRSFNGAAAIKKSTEDAFGAKSCGRNGAVVDLEDCCHMTLCETPCVEATFRKASNRRNRRGNPSCNLGNPSVSIISSPAKSNSDTDRDGLIENEEVSDNDMDS